MTKLGAHVTGKDRNGYGPFCEAKPALVVAVNEGGAGVEAMDKSRGQTVVIFRDTSIYTEFPSLAEWTEAYAARAAEGLWVFLREKWLQNPADYYTITNEQGGGGDDPHAYRVLIAYERRIMQLANAEGFKVCVLNLASGSPGDLEMWKCLCLPFIREACAAQNIYGRHAYGDDLVPLGGNTNRPFVELPYLEKFDGMMAITELGVDGGYGFAGVDYFVAQAIAYDHLASLYPNLIGFALWELGNTEFDASWQDALPRITGYLHGVPEPLPIPMPPPQPIPHQVTVVPDIGWLNLRAAPGIMADDVGDLHPAGGLLEVLERDGDWYKVAGWAHGDYLAVPLAELSDNDLREE